MTSQRIESSRSEAAVDHDVDDGYLQQLLLIIYLKCIEFDRALSLDLVIDSELNLKVL